MNNCEILRKSYLKALENGFRGYSDVDKVILSDTLIIYDKEQIFRDNFMPSERDWYSILGLVFDHNFAKAFFGNIQIGEEDEKGNIISYFKFSDIKDNLKYDWQAHLQIMALSKEPLKYLEKFL